MSKSHDSSKQWSELPSSKRAILERQLSGGDPNKSKQNRIPLRPNRLSAPLSFAQQRLWLFGELEPGSPVYNRCTKICLTGPLDAGVLGRSLNEIVRRHESLRTTLGMRDESPVQMIQDSRDLPLPIVDLSKLPAGESQAEVSRLTFREAHRPFDLGRGPLVRATLLRTDEREHVLVLTVHHIIFDGWSVGVFLRELGMLYDAFAKGRPSPLADLPIQYGDFAAWQRERFQGEMLEKELSYWRQHLAGAPPRLELPTDHPRPAVCTYRGATQSIVLGRQLVETIRRLSQQEGVTLFMTFLAALNTLLSCYTRQHDVVVGTPIAGRTRVEMEELIGCFINTLVFRTDLSGNPTVRELLQQVRRVALGAYAHQELPFERLVEELRPERNLSQMPIFQVMLNFRNIPKELGEVQGLRIQGIEVDSSIAMVDLVLEVIENPEGLGCRFRYNTDLFEAATVTRMLGHFRTLLEEISANPDRRLVTLPLLTAEERHQLLVEWNSTNRDYPRDKCVHELFEEQAVRTPDSVAVAFECRQLTYAELNARANQLAHYLRSLGVGPEMLVAVCFERSLEMLVGLLGILKAGGAYVPLDPRSPKDRLDFMLEDSRASILLTQRQLLARLPEHVLQAVCLDRDWKIIEQASQQNPTSGTKAEHIAYIIYTSGSTGQPKGVMIEHRSFVNYLFWVNESLLKDEGLSLPTVTGLTFDASLKQMFAPLLRGGEVWILPDEIVTRPDALLQALGARSKVGLNCVPSLWKSILGTMSSGQVSMRAESLTRLFLGGERFDRELVERTLHVFPNLQIWNLYGPTEATANASVAKIAPDGDVTIGRPIANTQVYILNSYQQSVPIGVAGELYIGGEGLARGYLNLPGLTAERFVVSPFGERPGGRLYKTGDLARYLPDGNIEFLGRLDHQVKIRGYRVELGEIEGVLGQLPGVREAIVMTREDGSGDRRLVAYIIPTQKPIPAAREWRILLREKLPEYMLPSAFVLLDALPVMPNGKIDRKALPAPEGLQTEREGAHAAPRTELERTLAAVWQEMLQVESVGVDENFFDLGGHSLLTVKVHHKLRGVVDRDLSVIDLFKYPTISSLANYLSQGQREPQLFHPGYDRAETRRQSMERQREFRQERRLRKPRGVQDE